MSDKKRTSVEINVPIKAIEFKDKATDMWIIYSAKYNLSAYGRFRADAIRMFQAEVKEILVMTTPNSPARKGLKTKTHGKQQPIGHK
jgi:hypothetical protein